MPTRLSIVFTFIGLTTCLAIPSLAHADTFWVGWKPVGTVGANSARAACSVNSGWTVTASASSVAIDFLGAAKTDATVSSITVAARAYRRSKSSTATSTGSLTYLGQAVSTKSNTSYHSTSIQKTYDRTTFGSYDWISYGVGTFKQGSSTLSNKYGHPAIWNN